MKRLAALLALPLLAACAAQAEAHKPQPWPGALASDPRDRTGWSTPHIAITGEGGRPLTYHPQRGVLERT